MCKILLSLSICLWSMTISVLAAEPSADLDTVMCERGKVILSDDFAKPLGKAWQPSKGKWDVVDGMLVGAESADDMHGAVLRTPVKERNFIMQYSFKLDGAKSTTLSINDPKGHNSRVVISKGGFSVRKDDSDGSGPDKPVTLQDVKSPIKPGEWHTIVVEFNGPEMLARLDGKEIAYGSDKAIGVEKNNIGLTVTGESVAFKDVRIWEAKPKADWAKNKANVLSAAK
ncbi:family 16 glycoside hydrolase [Planctomicrobium piriforme]|uniref:3-keto-alpha-glucoside-1,2-lyase/3-keto-2-hydroxy-glucal hydratase domain-containing protein n=1 Tax=Planctomicrobium piriforme TaxID=1576369 RepID=A0A1I3SHU7_9PLAN|nr:family 16 glycoside hydrolase [Planctomicrobium piriforme]SFJ57319.1 protein of unknown function [Planctomicrobium piriforme]